MSSDIFNSSYLIFSNRLKIESSTNNYYLPNNYRLVTLHTRDKEINNNLLKIIFSQIKKKSSDINNFFHIGCPIARGNVKKILENLFITDHLKSLFNSKGPNKIKKYLLNYFIEFDDKPIDSLDKLNKILDNQNYDNIKKMLGLELQVYKPGELCPKILFNFDNKLSTKIPFGLFDTKLLPDLKSLIEFENNSYELNESSFFEKIKKTVPNGLLILLPSEKLNKHTKYYIDYK